MLERHYFITIKLYGFDALAMKTAEVEKILEKSKEKILTYKQFTDTVNFVLFNIKSENYRTGNGNAGSKSFCVIETIYVGECGNGLVDLATDVVVSSLKNFFSLNSKDILFLVHNHPM